MHADSRICSISLSAVHNINVASVSKKRYAASELQLSFTREESERVLMSGSSSLITYSNEK
jgi:hypothetical protein